MHAVLLLWSGMRTQLPDLPEDSFDEFFTRCLEFDFFVAAQ